MKDLFNEFESINDDGREVADAITRALNPIFEKYHGEGFRATDIEMLAVSTAVFLGAKTRVDARMAKNS